MRYRMKKTMRSESEVHPPIAFGHTAVRTRAVRKASSLIMTVSVTAFLQLAPAYGQNSAPPTSSSASPSFVAKDIVSDFGAKCDGKADDTRAFAAFNKWARAQTLQVQLTIPAGSKCEILSASGGWWAEGIPNLLVLDTEPRCRITIAKPYRSSLAAADNTTTICTRRELATVRCRLIMRHLLTPSQTALYSVGNYALITGFDLQGSWQGHGYGYPTNPHYFEYVLVSSINAALGQSVSVHLSKTPINRPGRFTTPAVRMEWMKAVRQPSTHCIRHGMFRLSIAG